MSVVPFQREDSPGGKIRPLLGDLLCARGILNQDQLRLALHEQKQRHDLLGRILVRLRFAREEDILQSLSDQTGYPVIDLAQRVPEAEALEFWGRDEALVLKAAPVAMENSVLSIDMADPLDLRAFDHIRRLLPEGVIPRLYLTSESALVEYINHAYGAARNFHHRLSELEQEPALRTAEEEHPVVRAVDALLDEALAAGASDIHLEPEEQSVRVRIRIDGVLQVLSLIHRGHWPMLAQRLKVMAGMDIVDSRNIQDGRFTKNAAGRQVDFRVSILPTLHGENIVIRILDQNRALLPLEGLGFSNAHQALLRGLIQRPEGMIILTGPTGSGKTTTLYALLQLLNTRARNIMTLEDPVEYELPGIRQTQVKDQFGLGFAEGVRAVLRQDPDVVLIGEIRDPDTAQMGLRAAMTGNQVFSTLHTQDCFGVFPRLREFGLSSGLMSGNIIAAVGQRLVRTLCPQCRTLAPADVETCRLLRENPANPPMIGTAKGCLHCRGEGYKGRIVVAEVLPIDAELDELISQEAPRPVLQKAARQKGFIGMAEDGFAKLKAGLIGIESLMTEVDLSTVPPARS
ncbi:MAG: Flp pilus assembly complex ATPase component TadA [Proteobacteria bacterium]|nr:Flp pilus assembly complex ATPase component TadA [Pseudomonadota bacterium]